MLNLNKDFMVKKLIYESNKNFSFLNIQSKFNDRRIFIPRQEKKVKYMSSITYN